MYPSLRAVYGFFLGFTISMFSIPSHAGLFDDDEARKAIIDLRSKVHALETVLNNKTDQGVVLDQVNQLNALRDDIAQLRGQLEVLSNEVADNQKRQKDFYTDLDSRLRRLEPQKVVVDNQEVEVTSNEKKHYDEAQGVFQNGQYKEAEQALQGFIRQYPRSVYFYAAQYLLGTTYYAQKQYKAAIATFQLIAKHAPNHEKAPEALLNMASCYLEQKDKANAKKTLLILRKQYPDTQAAKIAQERLASL